jgi:hypothetical protein
MRSEIFQYFVIHIYMLKNGLANIIFIIIFLEIDMTTYSW